MRQPGLMMSLPLLLSSVIEHAAAQYSDVEVVSRETHGPLFRYTYAECAAGARKLANAEAQNKMVEVLPFFHDLILNSNMIS